MPVSVQAPFPWFPDSDGADLDGGYIYIGQANTDPVVQANRVSIFSDPALTVAMPNPFRTVAGFPVDGNGAFQNVYVATDFSFTALGSNNLTRLYTCASYAMRFLSDTVTFGTGIFSVGIRGAVAAISFNGTNAIPWESVVSRAIRARTVAVFDQTQPVTASDFAKVNQLMMPLLAVNQDTLNGAATWFNGLNVDTATSSGGGGTPGVYTVVPKIALPSTNLIITATVRDFLGGTGKRGITAAIVSTTSIAVRTFVPATEVADDCSWSLKIEGNPAVADPIS